MAIIVNLTGIMGHDSQESYAVHILKELIPKIEHHNVLIIGSTFFPYQQLIGNFRVLKIPGLQNKFVTIFFTQIVLPVIALFRRSTIYSPTPSFPIIIATRCFCTIHDFAYVRYPNDAGVLARWYMQLLYWFASKYNPVVFTVSNAIKNELSERYHRPLDHIVVAYGSLVSFENMSISNAVVEKYILYPGIYRRRKNIEYLLEVFSTILYTTPHKLVLMGSVIEKKEYILRTAREYNIPEDRIIFTGKIKDTEKYSYFAKAQAVVFLSTYEGFGFPILEAAAAGVPIILSDIPVFREVAGENSFLVSLNSSKVAGERIQQMLVDQEMQKRLIETSRENLGRFSWKQSAEIIAHELVQ